MGCSKKSFNRIWLALVSSFPNAPELPESTFEVYYAALHDYEPETIAEGVKRFCLYSDADFFPALPRLAKWITEPFEAHTPVEVAITKAVSADRKRMLASVEFMRMILQGFKILPSELGEGNRHVFVREWVHSVDPWRDKWRWQLEPAQGNRRSLCQHIASGKDIARGFICAGCVDAVIADGDLRVSFSDHFVHHLMNSFRVIGAKQIALRPVEGTVEVDE